MKTKSKAVSNEHSDDAARMKEKDYEKEMFRLHVELIKLQEWVTHTGARSASSSRVAMAQAKAERSRRSPSG
jgi:polyphosphate kinase 2 (PPK2 family)